MYTLRPSDQRGRFDHGWLDTRHTFSFGHYLDQKHMGFRDLRVINDDIIQGGQGFGTHPHRNMEIITWVIDGALEHRDNLGSGSVLRPGDVQLMSAGRGITHSEFNHDPSAPLRLLQVWVLPAEANVAPGYQERFFDPAARQGRWQTIATPAGDGEALRIGQDVSLLAVRLDPGEVVAHTLAASRHAWIQVATGTARLGDLDLAQGDGVAVSDESVLRLEGLAATEILLFDLC